jgi:putative methyltransferase (TIGR04325 family)
VPRLVKSLRLLQIRAFAALLDHIGRRPRGQAALVALRQSRVSTCILNFLLGYRRVYASFAEAEMAAAHYIGGGHEHPSEIQAHIDITEVTRESDYAALFHLAPIARELRHVFDLGGSVGNLFYSYARHLRFAADLTWTVCELPATRKAGERLAAERGETRLRFTDRFDEVAGADLLIICGALHYFAEPLAEMLGRLERLPERVLINRAACSRGASLITVQEAHGRTHLVACRLHGRAEIVEGMLGLGYRLRADWPIHERRLWVPLYPDRSLGHYLGFYFERRGHASAER